MTKTQVEVITSVQRRRRWSRAEKERIVAAAIEPGAIVSEVARQAGIHQSQLFRWRQQLCERAAAAPSFAAVAVAGAMKSGPPPQTMPVGLIEVELASGTRLRISGAVDAATVTAVMRSLAKGAAER